MGGTTPYFAYGMIGVMMVHDSDQRRSVLRHVPMVLFYTSWSIAYFNRTNQLAIPLGWNIIAYGKRPQIKLDL